MSEETFLLDKIKHISGITSITDTVKDIVRFYTDKLIDKDTRNRLIKEVYKRYLVVQASEYRNADAFINIINNIKPSLFLNSSTLFCIENVHTHRCLAIDNHNDTTVAEYIVWFRTISEANKYFDKYLAINYTVDSATYKIIDTIYDQRYQALAHYTDKYGSGYKLI